MTDIIPDNTNPIANTIGLLFHPFVVAVVTLPLVLYPLPLTEVVTWTLVIAALIIGPVAVSVIFLQKRQKYTYQRRARGGIYLVGWTSVAVSLLSVILLDGPHILRACMAALLVWVPLQAAINARITKVSTHVAVVTGCVTALFMLGILNQPVSWIAAVFVIAATAWARITTRNHTLTQVALGVFTGMLPVLVTFPVLV